MYCTTTKNNSRHLQLITTSLFYLSEEAKKTNLDEVSSIILSSIDAIEKWTCGHGVKLSEAIVNKETVAVLSILLKLAEIPEDQRSLVIQFLEETDGQ